MFIFGTICYTYLEALGASGHRLTTSGELGLTNWWSNSCADLAELSELSEQTIASSDRSSYCDNGLLYISGSSNFFRFSLSPLMQLMVQVSL